jgi:hypothetical protein
MKLITEVNEQVRYISEEKEGKKSLYIEGVFLQSNIKNRNGRMYPGEIMEKEINRYMKEAVENNRAFGELGHPDGPSINLDRVSHIITELRRDGDNWVGKAKLTETPMGNIARGLIESGGQLGVSSRGLGTLRENKEGVQVVQDDFHLATAADIVADPSAPDAFVRGIMENKEWVVVNGVWTEQHCDMSKKHIKKASKKELEEAKMQVFESFLRRLSSKY